MDRYRNFAKLASHETIEVDNLILAWDRGAPVVVLAPRGGGLLF